MVQGSMFKSQILKSNRKGRVKVAASILNCDLSNLAKEIKKVQKAGCDMIHLDVMDGQFVPNLSFGVPILQAIRPITKVPIFSHLMIVKPENLISEFAKDSEAVIFHIEATSRPKQCLRLIEKQRKLTGIALNPDTPLKAIKPFLNDIYEILIMSVNPGFGGQKFIESTYDKVRQVKEMIQERNIVVAVDGGVNPTNAKELIDAGADILVAGTAIFKSKDYAETIRQLKNI